MHRATFDLVWLGVLILTPGVGVPAGPVCPAFPLRFRLGLSAGGRVRPVGVVPGWPGTAGTRPAPTASACLLYTSDAADEEDSVDLGGRRIIKKKKHKDKK